MKRIDYFWHRAALQITSIVFFSQLLVEMISTRKPGFEWVLPVCGAAFGIAIVWTICTMIINVIRAEENV